MASLAATGFSVTGLHTCTRVREQPLPLLGVTRELALGSTRNLPLEPDPFTKLSEALCSCVLRLRQVRLRTLVEESEDTGGECFAQRVGLERSDVCMVEPASVSGGRSS